MKDWKKKLSKTTKLLGLWCLFVIFAVSVNITTVSALSQSDLNSIYNDSVWYKIGGSSGVLPCSPNLVGSENKARVWNYLIGQGLTELQVAGIMGNMQAEAHFEPRLVEYGWLNSRGETSVQGQPSSLDDNVPPDQNSLGQPGYGIVQWTSPNRKQGLRDLAVGGIKAGDLGLQLDYLWQELNNSYADVLRDIKASTTLEASTNIFLERFEKPGDIAATRPDRLKFAQDILDEFTGSSGGSGGGSACDNSPPAGSTIDMANLYKDSSSVGCAVETRNIGVYDGYADERLVKIRLCALPNLPSTGQESNGGYGVTGGNGQALVNSRASGAWYALIDAMKKAGISTRAGSSFRTMAHQQALCAANTACSGGDYTSVAKPGTSNHQMGLAIDFGDIYDSVGGSSGPCLQTSSIATYKWLADNASRYGIKQYCAEAWHWSPTGN